MLLCYCVTVSLCYCVTGHNLAEDIVSAYARTIYFPGWRENAHIKEIEK